MLNRILLVLLIWPAAVPLAAAPADLESAQIRVRIETIRDGEALAIRGQPVSSVIVLPALYERRDYAPVWTRAAAVQQYLQVLDEIHADGLNPGDYHQTALQALSAENAADNPVAAAEFDILLTDSLIRLGYHLLDGKVDAEALDSHWNMTSTVGDLDTVLAMAAAIEDAKIPALVEQLRPDHPYYATLRRVLTRYRTLQEAGGWPTVPAGATLKPGMDDPRTVAVRQRLAVTGEYAGDAMSSSVYDEALKKAVKDFQRGHGLTSDGVIGPATLAAMNVPVEARIDQIRVNLERGRWVLHNLPDEYVLTDIAGFRVNYVRNGETIWSARAQVGKPYRKTPVFRDTIRYLEINPTWTVPPTILRKDILPKVARDPGYLATRDMQVLTYDRTPVDPASIDWSQYPAKRFPYLIRQNPGPRNALGRIKFMFPNKHAVYLHDTPSRSLFARDQRAFSSGCIRIQNPFDFAVLLLDDPQWNAQRIEQVVDSGKTTTVHLPRPVTVLLLYWTVDTADDGRVIFKPDVYQRDPAILGALEKPFAFRSGPILDNQAAIDASRRN